MKITNWILKRFIKDYQKVNDVKVRTRYGLLEGWSSIIINLFLFIFKLIAGLSIKSMALIADAIHTLSDSLSSVVVVLGFKIAGKPSDKEHPFGHGRMESVAALVVSVLLFVAGIELIEGSIKSIITPDTCTASNGIIFLVILTMVIKELMARFSYNLGRLINSQALKADAFHHRTDVISTGLVVVALVSSRFGYARVDGIIGVFVALIIFYSAYLIAKESINPLLGEAPSRELIEEIEKLARISDRVLGVHDIIFHKYGQTSVISLHIEVSDKESAFQLHELSESVEEHISKKTKGVVVAHIDPINREHPKYDEIAKVIDQIVKKDKRIHGFHDLRIVGGDISKCNVIFEISLKQDIDEKEKNDIISSTKKKFKHIFPQKKVIIKVDPKYAYTV